MKLKGDTHSMMSSMVWLMICFTLSVSSSAIPCSPMLNDASLVLPSYLRKTAFQNSVNQHMTVKIKNGQIIKSFFLVRVWARQVCILKQSVCNQSPGEVPNKKIKCNWSKFSLMHCCYNPNAVHSPYDRREVSSDLGFNESFVEGRVRSRDH